MLSSCVNRLTRRKLPAKKLSMAIRFLSREPSTTSFSVIDKDGNMITITQTINDFFGAGVVPDGTGIMMNNEMDDFSPLPEVR
jgi:gamma-glutamyltranspeptidase